MMTSGGNAAFDDLFTVPETNAVQIDFDQSVDLAIPDGVAVVVTDVLVAAVGDVPAGGLTFSLFQRAAANAIIVRYTFTTREREFRVSLTSGLPFARDARPFLAIGLVNQTRQCPIVARFNGYWSRRP